MTFDWNQVRAFLVTAEEGSLSAAARALGLTQPTLGRQVAALERSLDVVLFDRIGKSLKLTEAGLGLLEHARAMGAAAGRVSLSASGRSQAIEGHVSVTASDLLSAYTLPPVVAHLRDIAPGIRLEIVASNSLRDLTRREADIAIRHLRPEQSDLIARRVGDGRARLYASRAYLDRVGRPETRADLARMSFIGFDRSDTLLDHLNRFGLNLTEDRFQTYCGNGVVVWQMLRQGLGVAVMPCDLAGSDPSVEAVLPDLAPFDFPVWLVAHRELHASRRIRLVFDTLAAALTGQAER
ncbi:LysR family transcriptional regulator [Sedimentitalea xiamensis]|nr:LysR family transcriptional regulator [Sedimentitalea xiamensis]